MKKQIAAQRMMGLIITGVMAILVLARGIEFCSVLGITLGCMLMFSKNEI